MRPEQRCTSARCDSSALAHRRSSSFPPPNAPSHGTSPNRVSDKKFGDHFIFLEKLMNRRCRDLSEKLGCGGAHPPSSPGRSRTDFGVDQPFEPGEYDGHSLGTRDRTRHPFPAQNFYSHQKHVLFLFTPTQLLTTLIFFKDFCRNEKPELCSSQLYQ